MNSRRGITAVQEAARSVRLLKQPHCRMAKPGCSAPARRFLLPILTLLATATAGICVRLRRGRRLRPLFLLGSVVVLGSGWVVVLPIKGYVQLFLLGGTAHIHWMALGWFLALIPATYLFGPVWCGWVCQLGAIQEFLFHQGVSRSKKRRSAPRARLAMGIKLVLTVSYAIWLLLTSVNLWERIDPFKSLFNLYASGTIAWLLLVSLLISSLWIFRPFCRFVCPVGLVVGLTGRLRGAAGITQPHDCRSCGSCPQTCPTGAIDTTCKLARASCIGCGACLYTTPKCAMTWSRNTPTKQKEQTHEHL